MVRSIGAGVVIVAMLACAPAAGAAVTHSAVTAPANGAGFDFDIDAPGTVTVSGTATTNDDPANDSVRIVCTYAEDPDGSASALTPTATGQLTPTGPDTGTFSVQVSLNAFDYFTCRLRAVPSGPLPADYRPFTGPVAHFHGHYTIPPSPSNQLTDYYQDISGPLGYWDGASTSDCFVFSTYTLDPATLGYGGLFDCARVSGPAPGGARAALQVDGHDAFLPFAASAFPIAGRALITGFARHLVPATGDVKLSAVEPAVRCADNSSGYPPTCPAWTAAGLSDRSLTIGDHGGRLVRHTDVWTNSGAVARRLDVWYQVRVFGAAPAWRFPDEAAYALHTAGDTIAPSATGPASVLVAADPAQADYANPRGSVTWSAPPDGIRFTSPNGVYLHYARTVPADGATAISLAFATDASQANADALSADARAVMRPSVTLVAPARVATSTVRATGSARDDGPVSVTVNGRPAAVSAAGTWSVLVPLAPGANTLVATATDGDGNTARAARTVTRASGGGPPPAAPSNQFTLTVRKKARAVRAILHVPAPGLIRAKLNARGQRLDSVRKTVTRARKVSVGLRLGRQALARLHRTHRLRARVTASFRPTGGTTRKKTRHLRLRS